MTIFGKRVSVSVLIGFVVSVVAAVGGGIVTILNGWGTGDPSATLTLVVGVVGTVGSALIHTWDTMPANVVAAAPPTSGTAAMGTAVRP
jgi:hypothetical protein